jgi:hypothetical protein
MTVSILRPLEYSDAGRVRMLYAGEAHDLPDVVACGLIHDGAAVLLMEPAARAVAAVVPPESGRRRRRA